MVANSPNSPLQIPLQPKTSFEIVGSYAVFTFAGGAIVAFDPTRVLGVSVADIGVRVIIMDGGGALAVKCNDDVKTLTTLIDTAARTIDGD